MGLADANNLFLGHVLRTWKIFFLIGQPLFGSLLIGTRGPHPCTLSQGFIVAEKIIIETLFLQNCSQSKNPGREFLPACLVTYKVGFSLVITIYVIYNTSISFTKSGFVSLSCKKACPHAAVRFAALEKFKR